MRRLIRNVKSEPTPLYGTHTYSHKAGDQHRPQTQRVPPPIKMPYSQKIIDAVAKTPKSLGNQLGRWAVYHDFPVTKVAKALGVTRQTVYNWFTGTEVFVGYRDRAEIMLEVLKTSNNADDAWRRICREYNLKP